MHFYLIQARLFCKAKASLLLAWVALIQTTLIHLAEWCISPATLLFINQYSHATAHYSPIMVLYVTSLTKQHIEPGENILTYSDLLFRVSLIPPCFDCIDGDQLLCSLLAWPPCLPNWSRNICCRTHVPVVCVTGGVGRRWYGCCETELEVRIEKQRSGYFYKVVLLLAIQENE